MTEPAAVDSLVESRPARAPRRNQPDKIEGKPWLVQRLCRDLAVGEVTRADLAIKYGLARSSVTAFAKRHAERITEIRQALDQEFAGLWIASKLDRIASAQADFEMSLGGDHADYFEQIRTRDAIRKSVAEELGQLPPRTQIAVVPVVHVIETTAGEVDVTRDLT